MALRGFVCSAAVTVSMATLAVNCNITFTTAAQATVLVSIFSISAKLALVKMSGSDELFMRAKNTFLLLGLIGVIALALWVELLYTSWHILICQHHETASVDNVIKY